MPQVHLMPWVFVLSASLTIYIISNVIWNHLYHFRASTYSGRILGNVDMAMGLQTRKEKYDIKRSVNSIVEFDTAGNLTKPADMIFLGGGTESSASRRTNAIFMEASVRWQPVLALVLRRLVASGD